MARARPILAACCLLVPGTLVAQAVTPTGGPTPRIVLVAVTEPLFDGAAVAVALDPSTILTEVHRTRATVAGNRAELVLPGTDLPADLVVTWSPRMRQTFPLRTPELAAAIVREPGGVHRLELRLSARGLEPMSEEPGAPPVIAAGRFGGRAGGRPAPPSDAVREARAALDRGLDWLRGQQEPDGGWPVGAAGDPRATADSRALATGAACMVLLANGSTVHSGPDRRALLRGLCFLVEQTDPRTGRIARATPIAPLEEQALVTLALSEAWLLSRFEPLREAVETTSAAMARMLGDPAVSDRGDAGALAFTLFATISAQDMGLRDEALARVNILLRQQTGAPGMLLDAAAILAGTMAEDPQLAALPERAPRLLAHLPAPGATQQAAYVYLGTMAMYQAGQPHWSEWREALAAHVNGGQISEGDAAGSWPPADPGAQMRGRVWTTSMRLLALQVVHRFSRIVERR